MRTTHNDSIGSRAIWSHTKLPIGLNAWSRIAGFVLPLGATWIAAEQAYNFSISSKNATSVSLLLYQPPESTVLARIYRFSFPTNKTIRVSHMLVPASETGEARYYAYKIDGPFNPMTGDRFDPSKVLLDPASAARLCMMLCVPCASE